MAVDIPVIIDIDKAFDEAAKRINQAIKPMQKKLDDNALDVVVEINRKGDLEYVSKIAGDATRSVADLKRALKSVENQIEEIYVKSNGKADFSKGYEGGLVRAHVVLSQMLAQHKNITQEVRASTQEILRQAEAERRHFEELTMVADSIDDLNTKTAAWRKELNSASIGSKEFTNAAIMATTLSERLEQVNNQIRILGSAPHSLNELNAKLQEITRQFNALSEPDRTGSAGKNLLDQYKAVSSEIQKSGKSLQQMVQEEQRLAQLKQKNVSQRKYENAILNSTVKSMRILQEQERILSERLNKSAVGSSTYERLKKQLQDVRKEIERINVDITGTQKQTANLDVLLGKTTNRMQTLIKRSAQLIALHSATRFIRNVREVTAEFEMQRVALAGILQDTAQAESLFKQLKAAAVKSPFEIKDLVSFTKQLSAYRIETDKLFDVTMQLADVSAGLGVDMSRLVLAYGQVRAAAVLRGQELRQFTEAGIPLVELLADKFTQLNGRMVSTAEVFDLISKRAVSFQMVEEIFNDMTESGGMFYKMQEKQSDTLLGQWQKLKDAVSIMYDEIGNTSAVHKGMEKMLADAMKLMQNWRLIGGVIKTIGIQFASLKALSMFMPSLTRNVTLAKKAQDVFNQSLAASEMAARTGSASFDKTAKRLLRVSVYLEKAANSSSVLKQAMYRLRAAMAGGAWIGVIATALTAVIGYIVTARKEAERLGKELNENVEKGNLQIEQAERNFKRLANSAIQAADGSAEQRKALEELQRTYGDVIPSQDLQIDKLRELEGNYNSLTNAIKQKIEAQIHEQNLNQITETYGTKLGAQRKSLEKFLKQEGRYTTDEATRIIAGINDAIKEGLLTTQKNIFETAQIIEDIIEEQTGESPESGFGFRLRAAGSFAGLPSYYEKLLKQTEKFNEDLQDEEVRFETLDNMAGKYTKRLKEIREALKDIPEGFSLEQKGSFEFNEARWKQAIQRYKKELEDAFGSVDISSAFQTEGLIDFSKIIDHISNGEGTKDLKGFVEAIQKDYLNIAPQEKTTRLVTEAAKGFAESVGISMTSIQGYLKNDESTMADYAKSVQGFVESQKKRIQELTFVQSNFKEGANYIRPSDEDIEKEQKELNFLEKLLEFLKDFVKETNKPAVSYQQDPLIQIYKNRMKFMQDYRNGVEDLNKYLTQSQAIAKEQEIMEGRGASLGFDVKKMSGSREEMTQWYDETLRQITAKIEKLGGKAWSGLGVQAIIAKDTKNKTIKAWQDLLQEVFKSKSDFDLSQLKKDLEKSIKEVSEEIKRSETARNFYKDILDLTGDESLAATMSVSVYGGIGSEFKDRMQQQLNKALESLDADKVTDEMREAFANQDFKTILENVDLWGFADEWKKVLKEMSADNEKYRADWIKDIFNTYQKTKTFEERITDVQKKEAQKRAEIQASTEFTDEQKQSFIDASVAREAQEVADIELEALRSTYEWTQSFKDMERVSTETLENLIDLLDEYIEKAGPDVKPGTLRAVTEAKEQAQEQLASRDAYAAAADGLKRYIEARKLANKLEKEGKKGTKEYAKALDKSRDALKDAKVAIGAVGDSFNNLSSIVSSVSDILALDDLSDGKAVLGGIATGLGLIGTALVFINAMMIALESNPVVLAISAIIASMVALSSVISNLKVNKANKEIERQQEIIDALARSYDRLQKAADKVFGSEFVSNIRKQRENLLEQIEAVEKQLAAEQSKGKKTDDSKIKEYQEQIVDLKDSISDLIGTVSQQMLGSDLTSAARSFAQSWLDAYKEFGDTTKAIEDEMQSMMENLIVEAALGAVMKKALEPVYDMIDNMGEQDFYKDDFWSSIVSAMNRATTNATSGADAIMKKLEQAGVNIRELGGDFTGISKDIASASEESILGLAAGINTQNFYMSQIAQHVAAILAAMTGGTVVEGATGEKAADPYREQLLEYISSLPQMRADIYAIRSILEKAIRPIGATATHYIATKL